MRQEDAFKKFLEMWDGKSRYEMLKRLYALTRYAMRIDNFFSCPLCASQSELEAFDRYCLDYLEKKGGL